LEIGFLILFLCDDATGDGNQPTKRFCQEKNKKFKRKKKGNF
jgi:hypothetical protein